MTTDVRIRRLEWWNRALLTATVLLAGSTAFLFSKSARPDGITATELNIVDPHTGQRLAYLGRNDYGGSFGLFDANGAEIILTSRIDDRAHFSLFDGNGNDTFVVGNRTGQGAEMSIYNGREGKAVLVEADAQSNSGRVALFNDQGDSIEIPSDGSTTLEPAAPPIPLEPEVIIRNVRR